MSLPVSHLTSNLSASSGTEVYVVKTDSNGTQQWANQYYSTSYPNMYGYFIDQIEYH